MRVFFQGDSYYQGLSKEGVLEALSYLKQAMSYNERDWAFKSSVVNGRVPCLKAFFKPYELFCDITFTSGLAVENTKLLKYLINIQPEAKKLCFFMKKWLNFKGIPLKNYNIVLMTIFFLQFEGFLPSIKDVQSRCEKLIVFSANKNVPDYEVQFDGDLDFFNYNLKSLDDFRSQIEGFFDFYLNFDYENYIISPFFGAQIKKQPRKQRR